MVKVMGIHSKVWGKGMACFYLHFKATILAALWRINCRGANKGGRSDLDVMSQISELCRAQRVMMERRRHAWIWDNWKVFLAKCLREVRKRNQDDSRVLYVI